VIVAGIDIGGTNTVLGIVNRNGDILSEDKLFTPAYPLVDDFVSAVAATISSLVSGGNGIEIKGIGIGAPNANYYTGNIELAPNLLWKGVVPLSGMVREKTGLPVIMTNDANAAALGEMIFGAAKGMKDFIILTLGTGLGSGIVINGEVVYGHTGFAGEIGHLIVDPGGRECGCGRKGCLETYASATGLVRTVLHLFSEMRDESSLRNIAASSISSRKIAEAASKGDPIAIRAIDFTAEILALGIVNSVVFSSPRAVFIFGGLAQAGEILLGPVRKYVDKNIEQVFRGTVEILPSGLKESNAAVLGAAALAWKNLEK